ncbi:sodium:solute symporter family protein [Treponema parvum]|uniref:sodium:solute symporter family protein n=1 Tax=Treponema parvum TaxID=138851 RepID=UPI001AEC366D|nr:sodium:solute symporter family protein [Treponema parvum]QTQ16544.1 sodium:solute symporter family protein [Treponema parvum]
MTNFTVFFLIGFVIYIGIMIAIGTFSSRGKNTGTNYLTGGAQLPLYLIFATMGATLIGTGSSIGATSNGFKFGFGGSAYGFGAALGMLILILVVRKGGLRAKGIQTMAEEAQFHYNGNKYIKIVMSFMMYLIEVVWLGNHINGGATYLGFVTGLDPVICKLITVLAFGIYVIIGGYLAVVWTDLIQLIILVFGFIAITCVAIPMAGGWAEITHTLESANKAGNLSLYGYKTMGWMWVISIIWSVAVPCLGTPTYRIRLYTAKDDSTAVRGFSLSAVLLFVFSLLPALIGMAAFTIATKNGAAEVLKRPDFAFTYVATTVLGPVLGLLFMIAGLSATMSSGDSDAIAGTAIFIGDIYPIVKKKPVSQDKITKLSRVITVLTLALAFAATLFAKDVMSYISNVIGSIIPGVSVAMFLGAVWKKASWQGGIASVTSALLFGMTYLFSPPFKALIASTFTGPAIPATIIALVFGIIVSLLTPFEKLSEEERMKLVIASREKI